MNAVANKSPRRRAPRSIVAKLDLSDPGQRCLHALMSLSAMGHRQAGHSLDGKRQRDE